MLVIFIDALPASKNFELKGLKSQKLIPNLGYSVNLHNEIFNGKTPDQMGFFGEYLFSENPSKTKRLLFKILNVIEYAPFKLNYLFKIFLRKIFKVRIGQIPFKYVPLFKREGKYPFIGECPSVLDNFKKFITDDLKNGLGNRDIVAINSALDYLKKKSPDKNIFISLCDLDGIGHKYGTKSTEYISRLDFLQHNCNRIIEEYTTKFQDAPVITLSDHGMSDVNNFVDPKKVIEKIQKEYKVKCFYDSLYLQVFVDNSSNQPESITRIKDLLVRDLPVHVFSNQERIDYGITNPNFGNIIALLNDNLAFSPNLFGYIKMKAYHGYLANNDNNKGVFLFKNIDTPSNIQDITSIIAYDIINENTSK